VSLHPRAYATGNLREIKELSSKIGYVISNKDNAYSVSSCATKKIENKFSWKKIIEDLEFIVNDVVGLHKKIK